MMTSLDPPSYAKFPGHGEGRGNVTKIRVTPASNVWEGLKRANTAKERQNRLYTIVCLLIIGVVVFGGGIALVVVGDLEDIEDFIIIGGLFLGLGALFLLLIALTLLKPIRDRKKIANKESTKKSVNDKNGYIDEQDAQIDSPDDVKRRPKPSSDQLYGYDKVRIHLPGPEIVPPSKHKTTLPPPPPPAVAHPSQGASQDPLILSLPRESTLVTSNISNNTVSRDNGKVVFY